MDCFNENGVLPPGFCEYKLEEVEEYFVKDFKDSQTREMIFDGFKKWLKELYKVAVPEEMWVDGSFATSKINPNDIDVVVFLNYKNFSSELNGFLSQIGRENYCDTYYAIEPNDELGEENGFVINHRNYWRGQFGFDRQDLPKGMIRFNKEELNRIKEVINNV